MRFLITFITLIVMAAAAMALTSADAPNAPKPEAEAEKVEEAAPAETVEEEKKPGAPYPRDVRVSFMKACVGFHKEMLPPCTCMLKNFQKNIHFDEFVEISELEDPRTDARFVSIANHCGNSASQ
ncbi:MAG: hypothetical protein MRY32_02210 [Rickettsiales bacterium]|nr:hypothetical protein [Rickettsiales bacterium]